MLDIKIEIVNFLHHNGDYDKVTLTDPGNNVDFILRVGYWEQLSQKLINQMELELNVRISENLMEDDDCGKLYSYNIEIVDKDTGYTLNELNELDSNYVEEAMYLESIGADDAWGVA